MTASATSAHEEAMAGPSPAAKRATKSVVRETGRTRWKTSVCSETSSPKPPADSASAMSGTQTPSAAVSRKSKRWRAGSVWPATERPASTPAPTARPAVQKNFFVRKRRRMPQPNATPKRANGARRASPTPGTRGGADAGTGGTAGTGETDGAALMWSGT